MENIRRLSHDIKNHLEALKEDVEPDQKIEYINGIERKLNKYQSLKMLVLKPIHFAEFKGN